MRYGTDHIVIMGLGPGYDHANYPLKGKFLIIIEYQINALKFI